MQCCYGGNGSAVVLGPAWRAVYCPSTLGLYDIDYTFITMASPNIPLHSHLCCVNRPQPCGCPLARHFHLAARCSRSPLRQAEALAEELVHSARHRLSIGNCSKTRSLNQFYISSIILLVIHCAPRLARSWRWRAKLVSWCREKSLPHPLEQRVVDAATDRA